MTTNGNNPLNNSLRAIVGLALAWIVPGAGHAFVGRPGRAIIIFLVIGATFWGGIAMGGVMTVDREGQRWWFAAEMLTGVHGLVGWRRANTLLEKLGPEIQKAMTEDREKHQNNIRAGQRDLDECTRRINEIENSLRAATDQEERERLEKILVELTENRGAINAQIMESRSRLYTARNEHVSRLLAKQGLALVAPMATLARAYAGVAGLLNIMCMFDVFMLALIGPIAPRKEDDPQ
ncbi:MAG: hypothetical protein QGG42_09900 [Phycisphaerae bacterium]|jgi:hypothetical protein|nr:hypothetical protein [Phycisphaerae bacterium]